MKNKSRTKYYIIIVTIIVSFLLILFGINWQKPKVKDTIGADKENTGLSKSTVSQEPNKDSISYLCNKDDKTEVSKGQDTLSLRDFNVLGNGKDETSKVQNALNKSIGKVLYIPKQKGVYYLVGQLIVPDNISIVCHSDVIFMAKNDLIQDFSDFEVMWRFENSENVTFDAQGALFRMDKAKYSSEFNHIFMINGSENVILKNIRTEDSAGDGFYVGAIKTKREYPQNIKIENCTATNSMRQGLSVTSADGLIVLNSSFNKSKGASPESGVDIEPFNSKGVLRNIKFSNCKAIGNRKRGFVVNLMRLNKNSESVDIVFENCVARNNMEGFSNRGFRGVQGIVEMRNCTVKNSKFSGITESSCLANSVKKIYENCVVENSNILNKNMKGYLSRAGFYIRANRQKKDVIGNSEFINCRVVNDNNSHHGLFVDNGDVPYKNISVNNLQVKGRKIKSAHMPDKFK